METLRRLLPSPGNLIVFEAAGRYGSFTRAGEELGMSQAAVSYAVKAVERQLGQKLFSRAHRSVCLTEAGRRFHADVTLGLSHIRRSAEDLMASGPASHVTLSASTAFAALWMLPRLHRLREDLPTVDLRIQTSDRDVDISSENMPLGVRAGHADTWPAYESALLASETIMAIASPSYLQRYGTPETVAHLTQHRLIHLEEPFRPALRWNDWFASAGVTAPSNNRGLLINDYVLVIQAVLEGEGIALGWEHLIERHVAAGLLVKVTGHVHSTGNGYHLIWARDRPLGPSAAAVRDWLMTRH